jgi:hypothetical protein
MNYEVGIMNYEPGFASGSSGVGQVAPVGRHLTYHAYEINKIIDYWPQ